MPSTTMIALFILYQLNFPRIIIRISLSLSTGIPRFHRQPAWQAKQEPPKLKATQARAVQHKPQATQSHRPSPIVGAPIPGWSILINQGLPAPPFFLFFARQKSCSSGFHPVILSKHCRAHAVHPAHAAHAINPVQLSARALLLSP